MDHQKKSFMDYFIISTHNRMLLFWGGLHSWMCLITPFFYGYAGSFGFNSLGTVGKDIDYAVTIFFAIDILLKFFTEVK
jgi:hypothetical protein